jgi:regulatory protein
MRITALEPRRGRPPRMAVHVDGELFGVLPVEALLVHGIRADSVVDAAALTALAATARGVEAREAALRLLAVRARGEAELTRRLRAKGFTAVEIEPVLARLARVGMIDDASFAGMLARDRVRLRPTGPRRMVDELRAKGIDEETARAAVGATLEGAGIDARELARRATARWRPRAGEEAASARRRLFAFLARRGFDGELSREIVEEVLGGR